MNKSVFLLFFIALFLLSAKNEPSRFATPEEMAKALLAALKNNDSLRFLELYPTAKETNTAFVDPWKDSSIYDHQVKWAGRNFLNNGENSRRMFREARKEVFAAGYNWKDVEFVAVRIRNLPKRSPGINYLYQVEVQLTVNGYEIIMDLSDVMKTKDGWNCGLGMRVIRIETKEEKEISRRMEVDADRMIDSMNTADSINRVMLEKQKQEHKKPR